MNRLLVRTYVLTPAGKDLLREALLYACNELSTTHICLCDALDDGARHVLKSTVLTQEEADDFINAVVATVDCFKPTPNHSGYIWRDPDDVDTNDLKDLQDALDAHAERCLALSFLLAMSEEGDL